MEGQASSDMKLTSIYETTFNNKNYNSKAICAAFGLKKQMSE